MIFSRFLSNKGFIKFPTLLGLLITFGGLVAAFTLTYQTQTFQSQASASLAPQNVSVVNITDRQVTITWQTLKPTIGFIEVENGPAGKKIYTDERDPSSAIPYLQHFVTIGNLNSSTSYLYKIHSGSTIYPRSGQLSFKTTTTLPSTNLPPLIGKVLKEDYQPTEALVKLEIDGAKPLAAVTKQSGNFIIPLTYLANQNLSTLDNIPPTARLLIISEQGQTEQLIPIPQLEPLPDLILGQESVSPTPSHPPSASQQMDYDLNQDGVVNSFDRGIVLSNINKDPAKAPGDVNRDGQINQTDIDLIKQANP